MTNRIDTEALRALKERLRQLDRGWPTVLSSAADAIEQLLELRDIHGEDDLLNKICDERKDNADLRAAIEQLERELAQCRSEREEWMQAIEQANKNGQQYDELQAELAAEKELADQLWNAAEFYLTAHCADDAATYRKARGM